MRFVTYPLLGIMTGGLWGVFGGYLGTAVFQVITNDSCLEEECAIRAIAFGLFLMVAGAVLGALLGLWTAWRHHRRR